MSKPVIMRAVWCAAFCLLVIVAMRRWRQGMPTIPRPSLMVPAEHRADSANDEIAHAEDVIVAHDPFRLANAPPTNRYDPTERATPGVVAIAPARPTMILKAIIGPPWQALIDGIPGQPPGTLVQTGRVFDKLKTRTVTRDSVVIQGPDTTWVLSFRAGRRP
jgi:hypothetical protein